jgi:hypothetical protein
MYSVESILGREVDLVSFMGVFWAEYNRGGREHGKVRECEL